jgi:5-methylcytosine-specific restriction enzyme subunit McrC
MPATIVTLFEHQFRSYAEMGLYPDNLARREKVLARIEQVNERAGQEILHLGRKGIHANAQVGIVRVGDFTFEILPKLDWTPRPASGTADLRTKSPERLASANLITMLSYAYNLRLIEQDIAGLGAQHASWLDLLTRLFAVDLHREIRAGLAQEYVTREETLSALRGRWDVQRQLRKPGDPRAAFDVIYDDLSSDTPLNQVFRYTIEQLGITCQDPGSQSLLAELSAWFQPVTLPAQLTSDVLDGILFNRLNERFQPSFHLARMFLTGCIIQLTAGDLPAYAFVFDMNVLFERFIAGFLTHFRRQILPPEWQDCAIVQQAEGTPLYLGRTREKNLLRLRPDLLFLRKGQTAPLLVADTKYKRLDPTQRGSGAAPEDIYQMLAYAVRLKCPFGLLLYPQTSSTPVRAKIEIDAASLRLYVATLNLHIPLDQPGELIEELRSIIQPIA